MLAYNQATRTIKEATGCHVATIHHPGWSNQDRVRGHYSLMGNVDVSAIIEKDDDSDIIETTVIKNRDGDKPTFTNKLVKVVLGTDTEEDEISSCIIEPYTKCKAVE